MAAISVRLPDDLEQALAAEVAASGRARSALIREAIAGFVAERARARFMAAYVAEAAAGYRDPLEREALRELAEDFLPLENEALAVAEARDPDAPWPEETGERWWR